MTDAYIGLGSNLDGPIDQLHRAIKSLQQIPATTLIRTSSFYCTRPLGPAGQPDYINAVVWVNTGLTASALLEHMHTIEDSHGRTRNIHWGPRTLDLDLLLFGDSMIHDVNLKVPHPELHKRGFVLYPLYEITPEIVIPGYGPVKSLLQDVSPDDVRKLSGP